MLWLCAAAEVSLTEQKKTGDCVVLFVASSTASQFNFPWVYYFECFNNKQLNYINFLQKEKPTNFKDVPLLGRINSWLKNTVLIKLLRKIIILIQTERKSYEELISKYLYTIKACFLLTGIGLSVSMLYIKTKIK
jgi:hypothetical protein